MTDTTDTTAPPVCAEHPAIVVPAGQECPACQIEATHVAHRSAACDAMFPHRFRDAAPAHPAVGTWAAGFASAHPSPDVPGLLLLGPAGRGKTHQAYAALRAAVVATGVTWRAVTCADLYASMRPRSDVDPEMVMANYRTCGLLLVDDLGATSDTAWTEEVLYRVVDGRYAAARPIIATSNLGPTQLRERLGDRIAGRLRESCTVITLTGRDHRGGAR